MFWEKTVTAPQCDMLMWHVRYLNKIIGTIVLYIQSYLCHIGPGFLLFTVGSGCQTPNTSLYLSADSGPLRSSSLARSLCLPACPLSASTHPTPTCVPSWWTFSLLSPAWQTVWSVPLTTLNFRRNSAPSPRKVGRQHVWLQHRQDY